MKTELTSRLQKMEGDINTIFATKQQEMEKKVEEKLSTKPEEGDEEINAIQVQLEKLESLNRRKLQSKKLNRKIAPIKSNSKLPFRQIDGMIMKREELW